mgnify:CR=1 FL=1
MFMRLINVLKMTLWAWLCPFSPRPLGMAEYLCTIRLTYTDNGGLMGSISTGEMVSMMVWSS